MRRKKDLPTAQETSFDVAWAFFSFAPPSFHYFPFFPSLLHLPVASSLLVHCHSIWLGGSIGIVSLFCSCTHSHPMSSYLWWWFLVLGWWLCRALSWFRGCGIIIIQIKPIIKKN